MEIKDFFTDHYNKATCESILFIAAVYFLLKKGFDISLSKLLEKIFQSQVVELIINFCLFVILYAAVIKIYNFFNQYFSDKSEHIKPEKIHECLLNNNKEIIDHLEKIEKPKLHHDQFKDFHKYDTNVGLIIATAYRTLKDHLTDIGFKVSDDDLLLSYYHAPMIDSEIANINYLEHTYHHPPQNQEISTKLIIYDDNLHKEYACVKIIRSGRFDCYHKIIDGVNYVIGEVERRKTIKQYFGIPIKLNETCVGFLNVEIHNKKFFKKKKHMKRYFNSYLLAFKYLLEYQALKRIFFCKVAERWLSDER